MTKNLRKKLNLTQQQLATLLGVNIRAAQYWDAGKRFPDESSEMKLNYLAKRNCRVNILKKNSDPDAGDESATCAYCLSSIFVTDPLLTINGKQYDKVLCAVKDELKI